MCITTPPIEKQLSVPSIGVVFFAFCEMRRESGKIPLHRKGSGERGIFIQWIMQALGFVIIFFPKACPELFFPSGRTAVSPRDEQAFSPDASEAGLQDEAWAVHLCGERLRKQPTHRSGRLPSLLHLKRKSYRLKMSALAFPGPVQPEAERRRMDRYQETLQPAFRSIRMLTRYPPLGLYV